MNLKSVGHQVSERKDLKADLIVITDNNNKTTDSLINYLRRKLNTIGLDLCKISSISNQNYTEIKKEVINSLDSNDKNLCSLLVTTTSEQTDPILKSILTDINPKEVDTENISSNVVVYSRFLFLINQDGFYNNIAAVISYTILNQTRIKRRFLFEDRSQLEALKNHQKDAEIVEVKSRYGKYAVELSSTTPIGLKPDYILNNNYPNADYLVYNMASISRAVLSTDHKRADLKFLANKIDLDSFYSKIAQSISIVEEMLKRTTSSNQVCIAFNGGKDCCVVLYLFFAGALRLGFDFPLKLVVISIANPFEEIDGFIFDEIKSFYGDSIEYIVLDDPTKTLKEQLFELKNSHSTLDYILMGTRRSDASYYKSMRPFATTDSGWPSFIRVNPILDWTYSDVWYFIRLLKLPYCELYDRGYTSIDHANNTTPNRTLFDSTRGTHLPAYFLPNDNHERTSRL